MIPASRTYLLGLVALLAACSSSSTRSGFEDPNGGSFGDGNGDGDGGTGSIGSSGGPTTGGAPAGCSDNAKLVYVVSEENDLYSFAPDKLMFTKVGNLSCNALGATPNSMAIDRSGTAWVNYSNGQLFEVSTIDATCKATGFVPGQAGFQKFGMAFASNAAGSTAETLFVAGITDGTSGSNGQGLASIDLASMKLKTLGDFSGTLKGQGAELTGNANGELFGFFTTQPDATLAQIDKSAGATSGDVDLAGVSTGAAWAFSYWGGDFWFYTSDGLSTSNVTQLKASGDKSVKVVRANIGFTIVGAGVSTCAPTSTPH